MKKLILFSALAVLCMTSFAQEKKDTAIKKIPISGEAPNVTAQAPRVEIKGDVKMQGDVRVNGQPVDPIMFLVLPMSNWQKIINMLKKSKWDGSELIEALEYIQTNVKPVPAPADTTIKKK